MPFGRRIEKKKEGGECAVPKKVFPRVLSECKQWCWSATVFQCTELVQPATPTRWLDTQAQAGIWYNPGASQALKFLL